MSKKEKPTATSKTQTDGAAEDAVTGKETSSDQNSDSSAETSASDAPEAAADDPTTTTQSDDAGDQPEAASDDNGESSAETAATKEAADATTQQEEAKEDPIDLDKALEQAQQEAERNMDKWQRAVAELANFKRRNEEQLKLQRDRIKSEVLQGVISALDDMDLAFQNLPEELDGQLVGWVEGFRLVQRKLHRILDEQNVMPISTDGTFDPNFHEAVSYEESDDHDTDQIIAELRKGYQIGNRVIRPALVRVAS